MAGGGAGLVQDMVKTMNKNKSLLKKASGTYASFDHTSYSLPKNCKEPTFKEAFKATIEYCHTRLAPNGTRALY